MAILAECDICGNQHRVKDALGGSSIRCEDCGVKIAVPKDQFITPDTFYDDGRRLRRRGPVQRSSILTWFVAFLVSATAMGAVLLSIWTVATMFRFVENCPRHRNTEGFTLVTQLEFLNSRRDGVISSA